MTTVKASCPVCGDVEDIPAQAFTVCVELYDGKPTPSYAFTCPTCRDLVLRPSNVADTSLLLLNGARTPGMEIEAFIREVGA